MLLSRVAEAVYWTGRYLERAEGTARLVQVHTELFVDLPRAAGVNWTPLLVVTGSTVPFAELYTDDANAEDDVVRFLTVDGRNAGAVVGSLERARANLRIARPVFPRELWEGLNRLYLLSVEDAEQAVPRRSRVAWLETVISECQRLTGITSGSMSHDEAYAFLRIGRHVERADMTTRVLDVCAATFFHAEEQLRPYADVTWMSVLKSLSAYQTYRRRTQSRIRGADALAFLLRDPQFPRSVEHCLIDISRSLVDLPHHDAALALCADAEALVADAMVQAMDWRGLHRYADRLQRELANLHEALVATYFGTAALPASALASA
jgi:uncharacterized alpha-E superfamily protein